MHFKKASRCVGTLTVQLIYLRIFAYKWNRTRGLTKLSHCPSRDSFVGIFLNILLNDIT